ncbi:aminotransferase-like domain-containing protein [Chitinophaga nivalis]|uniref:PLP-dependent aminotransferase family protein n=1 Tax=Chitinophaga nivalis TaxID=2991709 RepID=A0ABT3ILA3_9BACT|nr:PLP-dependent aminotransferase family protein [Chitinophaga nivalis]MCW3465754.1 PLP-dependent aminotransferase family protein [Chitinophaga nivalis]MCW3484555.1 PLP-dependent aminotransferase family protein [Chitinophaga nivalis]
MLPFQTLLQPDKQLKQHVYQQIAGRLINLIQEGILQPGSYLPGSRVMADLLQLHRKTVIAAYEELLSQDWIVAIPRKGMMVATNLPLMKPRSYQPAVSPYAQTPGFRFNTQIPSLPAQVAPTKTRLVVNDGAPDVRLAPLEEWIKACRSIIQSPQYPKRLTQGPTAGSENLRQETIRYLSHTRGLRLDLQNILITRGAQMAIYLAASLLVKKGDAVIVASPNYFYADQCFEQLGAQLLRVPADQDGIDTDAVEQLCRTRKIRCLYIISHHHHPTTVTLSAVRRMKLLQLIRTYQLAVIEDDYDYDYHYPTAPILPLASADHGGHVIYIGSMTKSLGLSIRIGYMIAPAAFIEAATALRRLMDLRGDNLSEEALALLLADGTIERHLKKSNKIYHERRDLLCRLLTAKLGDAVDFVPPNGGMALWLPFHRRHPLPVLATKAAAQGVAISDGAHYNYGGLSLNALRFGFASLNPKEITTVVNILAGILQT